MSKENQLIIHRSSLILKAVGIITFGLVALCYPGEDILALMMPFGILVTLNALTVIGKNIRFFTGNFDWQHSFRKGLAELLIGLTAIVAVIIAVPIFLELIALWTILNGINQITSFYQLRDRMSHWLGMVAIGGASVLFGIFIGANLIVEVVSLTYEVAGFALVLGSSLVYAYVKLGRIRQYLGNRPGKIYSPKTLEVYYHDRTF
ncbi:MAG: hypothetical protein RIG62_06520 [Cyclobacteriaceae bacterium]